MPHHFYAICPLCEQVGTLFYPKYHYYHCIECSGIFRDQETWLTPKQEKAYYATHEYRYDDQDYRRFVQPLLDGIAQRQKPTDKGLDFGCGAKPVLVKWLSEQGYSIVGYDLFFANNASLLSQRYDYIVCCEVAEHLHQPLEVFIQLYDLLKPNGRLYCMTWRYNADKVDFHRWFYKNDPTHVFIYQDMTMDYICSACGFRSVEFMDDRLVVFQR